MKFDFYSQLQKAGVFIVFFLSCLFALGQGTVNGTIEDKETRDRIPFVNVVLLQLPDSTISGGSATNLDGEFVIEQSFGEYLLKVQLIGYEPLLVPVSLTAQQPVVELGRLSIQASMELLQEIQITGERQQVEMDGDKMIYNVSKDITTAGGTAEDAIKNLPSVSLDSDGNVSLRGSENVRIFINGRQSGLAGSDNAALLQQLPADAIESVEVITNPSSRYDAEGSAGIINIVLKRDRKGGVNGLFGITGGYPHDHTVTTNLEYNKKNWRIQGGYNFRYRENERNSSNDRTSFFEDSVSFLNQSSFSTEWEPVHNFSGAVEFRPSDRNLIYAKAAAQIAEEHSDDLIEYELLDDDQSLIDRFFRNSQQDEEDFRADYGLGYERTFDKKGQKFILDMSYLFNTENTTQENFQYYEVDGGQLEENPNFNDQQLANEKRQNAIFQTDYIHPWNNWKFEIGTKSSLRYIKTGNAFLTMQPDLDYFTQDTVNNFNYDEIIHAGYISTTLTLDKWSYQGGVRVENTDITTILTSSNQTHKKNYLNFFPSGFIGFKPNERNEMRIGATRRINRPGFWNLNPFRTFEDPLNIRVGNPDLDPEITWSTDFTYIKRFEKILLNSSVYYRHTDDVIERYRYITPEGVAVTTSANLAMENSMGVEFFMNHELTPWWKYNASINIYHTNVDGRSLEGANETKFTSLTARTAQTFTLPKKASLQINAFWLAPRKTIQGNFKGFSFVDVALRKDILKDKASITFRATDVFFTRRFEVETENPNFIINSEFYRQSRRFYISFTYKFNNYKESRRNSENSGGFGEFEDF